MSIEWTYHSKRYVLKQAIDDLHKYAKWNYSPSSLEVLSSILEDLHRLEDLEK